MADLTGGITRRRRGELDDGQRTALYDLYWSLYMGDQLFEAPREDERPLVINYIRVMINKIAAYLMGRSPSYRVTRVGEATEQSATEKYLQRCSLANNLPALDLEQAIGAAVLGDGAYTIRWDKGLGLPRVTAVDPGQLAVRYRTDDLRTPLAVTQTYHAYKDELPATWAAILPGELPPEAQIRIIERWTAIHWIVDIGGHGTIEGDHPWKQPPYLIFPNARLPGEYWGLSDVEDLITIQRQLNSRISDLDLLLSLTGAPVTVIEGVTDSSNIKIGPGAKWDLPEKAKAYVLNLLEQGVVDSHLAYINLLFRALHDISESPRTSFGDTAGQGATSGAALLIELQPLVHKLERRRQTWNDTLIRRAELLITMGRIEGYPGLLDPAELEISLDWPPVLPQDRTELVQQETALVGSKIHSRRTASKQLGDNDPDAEQRQVETEQAAEAAREQEIAAARGPLGFANGKGA